MANDKFMIGKRQDHIDGAIFEVGEYGKGQDGNWYGMPAEDMFANLSAHTVTEHEDRTITVSPSILVTIPHTNKAWHGFLERGIWREV